MMPAQPCCPFTITYHYVSQQGTLQYGRPICTITRPAIMKLGAWRYTQTTWRHGVHMYRDAHLHPVSPHLVGHSVASLHPGRCIGSETFWDSIMIGKRKSNDSSSAWAYLMVRGVWSSAASSPLSSRRCLLGLALGYMFSSNGSLPQWR
ncbi:hypothetical protein FA13DRAFT_1723722 [Coprinellus micaceus]|uniref:Uncharacterized protein n=1 Tax=Coprinellus micaceus TaxID=71717 RepID=A0A4Y7TZS7_COPMI|nr:hypothetical protein FA13DRAFT_1723722 [Coprinellus micaceus]